MSISIVEVALDVAATPLVMAASYLAGLALLARPIRRHAQITAAHTFDIIVPAHNEEGGIAATIESLSAVDYPADQFRVLVVADNCQDKTADIARSRGALVLERTDSTRRGKGYALSHGYERSITDGFAHAVVVVDADSTVSSNFLAACSRRLSDGEVALQGEYGVRNPFASWRTRLMKIAFALFHTVRSLAREKLRLSCGLRGNGMCFSTALLKRVPPSAFSIVEDVEYGIALGFAGVRVGYVDDALVLGEMPVTAAVSRSQRARWEGGRWELARRFVPSLLRASLERRSAVLLDLAVDLLIPPLSFLVALILGGTMISLASVIWLSVARSVIYPWAFGLVGVGVYVARGLQLSSVGLGGLLDLLRVPWYALWKLTLLFNSERGAPREWVRTARSDAR